MTKESWSTAWSERLCHERRARRAVPLPRLLLQRRSWDEWEAAGFPVEAAELDFIQQERWGDDRAGDAALG
jgi:hypothetical protein